MVIVKGGRGGGGSRTVKAVTFNSPSSLNTNRVFHDLLVYYYSYRHSLTR